MLACGGRPRHWEPKRIRLRIFTAAERLARGGGLRLRLPARWPRAGDLTTAVSSLHALARG